jgi:hypothetical protein
MNPLFPALTNYCDGINGWQLSPNLTQPRKGLTNRFE